jgi:hypothetical protein
MLASMRPALPLFVLLLFACVLSAGERAVICRFNFGAEFEGGLDPAPGFERVGRVFHSPRYLWVTPVRDEKLEGETDALLRTGDSAEKGEFRVGLDNGAYQVTLVMSDRNRAHGPFRIYLQDRLAKADVRLHPGTALRLEFPVKVEDRRLRLRFEADAGQTFLVNALILEGPAGARLHSMFENAPPDYLPSREELFAKGSTDVRAALRRYCEWLLAHRLPNGFLGDWGGYGIGREPHYYWYTTALPIRTLLAGYRILGEQRYFDAAANILDRLVEEQLPSGAFMQEYRAKPTSALTAAEIRDIVAHRWMNTADIGTVIVALASAVRYAGEPRKSIYRAAARRYCDDFAIRWQTPSGGFTNGLESGIPQTNIYSVATGTEAAAFAAVYAITGEEKYLRVAQRAAEFLLDHFQRDGRSLAYPHSPGKLVVPYPMPLSHVGETFYQDEGILFAYHHSRDQLFRDKVRRVYRWHLKGEKGFLSAVQNGVWWKLQDIWNNSKSAAAPLVVLAYRQMDDDPMLRNLAEAARRFLCTPEFACRIGIMVNDPELPWGGHSLQSWSGCAVAATGFGGLSLAEMAEPGAIWLQ